MRTETIEIYKYSELSEKAKERAYYDSLNSFEYFWAEENSASLQAFADLFDLKIQKFSYPDHAFVDWDNNFSDDVLALRGSRLVKYLYNNYGRKLYRPKRRYKGYKFRDSKIFTDINDTLTGYCLDYDLLLPVVSFINKPDKYSDITDILQRSINDWLSACTRDHDYQSSQEAWEEACEINNYEFYSDGRMI